jgi:hypothetical protein
MLITVHDEERGDVPFKASRYPGTGPSQEKSPRATESGHQGPSVRRSTDKV